MEGEAANLAAAAQQQAAGLTQAAQETAEAAQHKAAGLMGSALASAQASWGGRVWCRSCRSCAGMPHACRAHQIVQSGLRSCLPAVHLHQHVLTILPSNSAKQSAVERVKETAGAAKEAVMEVSGCC